MIDRMERARYACVCRYGQKKIRGHKNTRYTKKEKSDLLCLLLQLRNPRTMWKGVFV